MEPNPIFTEFQLEFFKRINISPKSIETLNDVSEVMSACAQIFSFENLDVVTNSTEPLNRDVIIQQLVKNKQSGLCYKINSVFYYFIQSFGFNIYQVRCCVENQDTHDRWQINGGHIINIIEYENKKYVADVAFGCNLSYEPIPISEADDKEEIIVESCTGLYRIRKVDNIIGEFKYTYILEFRKPDSFYPESARAWTNGYVFDPLIKSINDDENDRVNTHQTKIQQLIIDDPTQEFSVKPLATKVVNNESIATLTANSFTLTNCKTGEKTKTTFEENNNQLEQFNQYLISIFNLPPLKFLPKI
ncbi:hypothetical protein RB653_008563 [Dictyostelium firmibasis]|uniref:arylamine N-acetyltransferase n=1 Tax=Dictyostelium firmibasis TaxID=79012 RepID=A0AAN7U0A7_9MYCE